MQKHRSDFWEISIKLILKKGGGKLADLQIKIQKNDGNSVNRPSQGNTNTGISMMRSGGIAEALKKFENAGIKKKESITINTMINTNLHSTLITSISFFVISFSSK